MRLSSCATMDADIANRYLSDQLTDAERCLFEARLMTDPAVLRELEATVRLKRGLGQLRRARRLNDLVHERSWWSQQWISTAAAAVLGLTFGVLYLSGEPAPVLVTDPGALAGGSGDSLHVSRAYTIFRTRSDADDTVIELPPTRQVIVLRVMPDIVDEGSIYSVSLAREGRSGVAFALDGVPATKDGTVVLYADSSAMEPGRYVMTLTNRATAAAEKFPVEVK